MSIHTHVIEYDGGERVDGIGADSDVRAFANPLRRLNGRQHWGVRLYALPPEMTYDQMQAGEWLPAEYLEACGAADAMMLEICKPGGDLWAAVWGARWVRFVVGHQHEDDPPFDVEIKIPSGTEMVSRPEIFGSDEAARLFQSYRLTGSIPSEYRLRPIDGYAKDGTRVPPPEEAHPDETVRRVVYHGDRPGDMYEGQWPNRLTISVQIGPGGFTLHGRDSVEWPWNDQHWTIRVAPEHVPALLEAFGATPEMGAVDVLDLLSDRFEDRTIPFLNFASWLKDRDIEYDVTQHFLEN